MSLLLFITFTGADDHTDVRRMGELSREYPIEWGILLSPSRAGSGRYPCLDKVAEILRSDEIGRFSAHLCGGHARDVLRYGRMANGEALQALIEERCQRAQINTREQVTPAVLASVAEFRSTVLAAPILQCRATFPPAGSAPGVYWLFDASGGRGLVPPDWPRPGDLKSLVGYAGGIGPGNVTQVIKAIQAAGALRYWIDMESSLRDDADEFDLRKVEQVCRAVYGDRA